MVLFAADTIKIKNNIANDKLVDAKSQIDVVIQKALTAGFGVDGLLISELLHLKVALNCYLGIYTEEPKSSINLIEHPNRIVPNQKGPLDSAKEIINFIRKIQ